jgi:hypothetical protein
MVKSIQTNNYAPGTAVFLSLLSPIQGPGGCKARYVVEVYQQGTAMREIKGLNYDPGSPGNDSFCVLSSSQALPSGAVIRVVVCLQETSDPQHRFDLKLQQGNMVLCKDAIKASFVTNQIAVLEYDIFCS